MNSVARARMRGQEPRSANAASTPSASVRGSSGGNR